MSPTSDTRTDLVIYAMLRFFSVTKLMQTILVFEKKNNVFCLLFIAKIL